MKYYYLINGKIMSANEKVPLENDADTLRDYKYIYDNWYSSLQPCEISDSELCLILSNVTKLDYDNPIEVTDIVEERKIIIDNSKPIMKVLFFKQPKQVEEIESVEFAEWILDNYNQTTNGWHHNNWSGEMETFVNYTTKQLYEIFKNQK